MEQQIFEEILETEKNRIFNYLLKILRHREDAEDILQETFMAFYHNFSRIKTNAHLSYLYRIAHNKAINRIKKTKRIKNVEISYPDLSSTEFNPGINDQKISEIKNELIRKAFSRLKPKDALILELQFYQKMSYAQMAEVLEISSKAVDSRLIRAKKRLKKIILQDDSYNVVLQNVGNLK
ncbi:MAG: RNA polymerase sigma factor [Candidatus Cloacimonetes bacterium]|nr:RNA polymerase sigma factor [Candidatus Cloacimonadota bacterium]